MNLSFHEGSDQSRAPSRSRASKASFTRPSEAQSVPATAESQPPPQSSTLTDSIKKIVEKAMQETFGTLQTSLTAQYYELSDKLESEMGKLFQKVDSLEERMESIEDKLEAVTGHFEDLDPRFESLHVINQLLDSKLDRLMQQVKTGPSHPSQSPIPSPIHSPVHHSSPPSFVPPSSTPIIPPLTSSPPLPEATPLLPTPPTSPSHPDATPLLHLSTPPLSVPFVSSAPPTVILPTPVLSPAPSSSGDTADLFDEHSSSPSSPSHSSKPSSTFALTLPSTPPSLSLTIYSPLPILQALRDSLTPTPPILPDDKGGEKTEEKK